METSALYSDFGHLASLKADAAANPNAAIEDVAAQFESLFLQMMIKSMRDATMKSDLFSSHQMDTYMAMADQQIALDMAQGGGIGLARMMIEQMQVRGLVQEGETGSDALTGEETVNPATLLQPEAVGMPLNRAASLKAFELPAAIANKLDVEG